jgi:hypothetical protein
MWEVTHDGVLVDRFSDYWDALQTETDWRHILCPSVYEGVEWECPHDLDLKEIR